MTDDRLDDIADDLPVSDRVARTPFAHPSERVAAQILDFYRIAWDYEPTTFPLEWDKQGNVLTSFAPDFYLPEFDLYIELTTMSQKLVTKKNRKVRRLKELYPDISIKILYQKDFRKLLFKYGIPVQVREHSEGGGLDVAADSRESDT
jgi:hypoxanthine phosphoribosyltransferase